MADENDTTPSAGLGPSQQHHQTHPRQHQQHFPIQSQQTPPFQSQLGHLSQQQQQPQNYGQHVQQSFDLSLLAGALPHGGRAYQDPSANLYSSMQYVSQRGPQFMDPASLARAQQQQYLGAQFAAGQTMQRPQAYQLQQHAQYSPIDPYGYGMSPPQFSSIDPRYAPQFTPMLQGMPGMPTDMSQFARRPSADNAPIPNFPRGPPRKPKQSGHALWVGNLPPAAKVTDLKDHFSRDATSDIESVFLIAKSNCAFVNYRTEAACVAAMTRFHDSRFHGVRLVCRLRRGAAASSTTPANDPLSPSTSGTLSVTPEAGPTPEATTPDPTPSEGLLSPTIARSRSSNSADNTSPSTTESSSGPPPASDTKVPEKYFIVKSLTAQDLEASVRNGIWATQSHNEEILNRAYEQADNVYLIFSANKSGEYFGYARMASQISGEAVRMNEAPSSAEREGSAATASADPSVSPQSIPTPATATAPKGRIIDDSARGTIFWEAEHSEEGDETQRDNESPTGAGATAGQNWGRQFQIEWMSTNRLPFYRTRGLRNPWNASREVKIARDGTELEPGVGRKLVGMFARGGGGQAQGPAQTGQQVPQMPQGTMMGMPQIVGMPQAGMGGYR
ncbi:unnamed protein product [Zymoseptoria tritici ST99CH_3D1]|nr:unnamed protein product [Zymoseptoria tritici ST99CH_3D1]